MRIEELRIEGSTSPSPAEAARGRGSELRPDPDAGAEPSGRGPDTVTLSGRALSQQDQRQVEHLKARDAEVRAHEQAHLAAAGSAAQGGPTFTYTRGPDGKQYATGGEGQVSVAEGRTPQETIARAARVRAAALAPAEPSGQDRSVAVEAAAMEAKARGQMVMGESGSKGKAMGERAARCECAARACGCGRVDVVG